MRIESANVVNNLEIAGGIWHIEMEAPGICGEVIGPGQFINIAVSDSWQMPLRRPMSIAGNSGAGLEIIYKLFGKGTKELSEKRAGDSLNILGPVGNTFKVDVQNGTPILVGGGVGIAPILWLHHRLQSERIDHKLIIGAVTADEHFLDHNPREGIFLTTDDGSLGEVGTVMPTLERLTLEIDHSTVFACGPEPMLKAIRHYTNANNYACQMALESYMACGTGLCQGCVIELEHEDVPQNSYHEVYSLVCCDGPVYDAKEIRM